MGKDALSVVKASGIEEPFDRQKLLSSLMKAGASEEIAEEVLRQILPHITHGISTRKLYHLAYKKLRKLHHASGLRYSLKKAIFRFGPTGYPFEQYFSEILKANGYFTETNLILQGLCIKHEVDVLAKNEEKIYVIECKYHHSPGRITNSKDALYVKSRFDDLKAFFQKKYPDRRYSGWLVTNTRFSTDAIEFAGCAGYRLTSWKYPEGEGLEKMIEDKRLYPVTILSGIKANLSKLFIDKGIILLKDLSEMRQEEIVRLLNIPDKIARAIKSSADRLCGC